MEGSWWKSRNDLDDQQEAIITLPQDGRYIVTGPPGCGKTNLLVLRAVYLARAGFQNLKLLTFGKALNSFIRTGVVGKGLDPSQVDRHVKWGRAFAVEHKPAAKETIDAITNLNAKRTAIASECRFIQEQLGPGAKPHQVILVDEVQDLFAEELDVIVGASDRLMLAGDTKQRVFRNGNGVSRAAELGFKEHKLTTHYRIGHAIAKVADRIFEPAHPSQSLNATCNYDESKLESSAELIEVDDRAEQFKRMTTKLRNQLKAYPKEFIGVLVAKTTAIADLRSRFDGSDLSDFVVYHDETVDGFSGDGRIHVMTIASAKGSEFRAVHLYAAEDTSSVQDNQSFWYTAVTRAKYSLHESPSDVIARRAEAQTIVA